MGQLKAAAEENMAVAMLVAGQFYLFQLLVKDISGRKRRKFAIRNPLSGKLMLHSFEYFPLCIIVSAASIIALPEQNVNSVCVLYQSNFCHSFRELG